MTMPSTKPTAVCRDCGSRLPLRKLRPVGTKGWQCRQALVCVAVARARGREVRA
jgi:hypothetical protein